MVDANICIYIIVISDISTCPCVYNYDFTMNIHNISIYVCIYSYVHMKHHVGMNSSEQKNMFPSSASYPTVSDWNMPTISAS